MLLTKSVSPGFSFEELLPTGALEVLTALLVQKDVALRHACLAHGNALPILVLIPAGYPDIAVDFVTHAISSNL